jgi:molybdopterin/thiamine biosynthesis adenylyltransferase
VELHEARILIAGATGPGIAAAAHLTAAGAPYVAIADGGATDGFNRADVLAARLGLIDPGVHADPYPVAIDETNAVAIATGHQAIVDATGNDETSLPLARAAAELGLPVAHCQQHGDRGTVVVSRPGATACMACARRRVESVLSAAGPASAGEAGLLAGLIGSATAADVGLLLNGGAPQAAVLRTVQLPPAIDTEVLERDISCAVCGAVAEAAR